MTTMMIHESAIATRILPIVGTFDFGGKLLWNVINKFSIESFWHYLKLAWAVTSNRKLFDFLLQIDITHIYFEQRVCVRLTLELNSSGNECIEKRISTLHIEFGRKLTIKLTHTQTQTAPDWKLFKSFKRMDFWWI